METPVRIAILGTGGMANQHVQKLNEIDGVEVTALCDVDPKRLSEFATTYKIDRTYTDLDKMLADGGFDGVCNVTPDAYHFVTAMKIIEAGYAILSEKPLATNYADARKMADAAQAKGVINLVNFSYRNSDALQEVARYVASGKIGEIIHLDAHYYQSWLTANYWGDYRINPAWQWRLSTKHGSKGTLGDVGVHLIDFASFASNQDFKLIHASLKCFEKDKVNGYNFDTNDTAILVVKQANGGLGTLQTTRWASGEKNNIRLSLYGTKGGIKIDLNKSYTAFEICEGADLDDAQWKTIECAKTPNMWQRFVQSIRTGINDQPDFEMGAKVQKILDEAYDA